MPFPENVFFFDHSERRRQQLGLRRAAIRKALREGEIIETHSDTGRGASYLLLS